MKPYVELQDVSASVFNICLGGIFTVNLCVDKPEDCLKEVELLTLAVKKECSFAKAVGKIVGKEISGVGEGIVWRLANPTTAIEASEHYWAKTMGPKHADVDQIKLPATFNASAKEKAKVFAIASVTEVTLERRWVELWGICGGKIDASQTGKFMEILVKDIEKEESSELKRLQINLVELKKEIGILCKEWFQARLKSPAS